MQDAGAAATELNMYGVPGDPRISGTQLEQRHTEVLQRVKDAVTVPVAVRLSPFYSSLAEMAQLLDKAGADARVLFNRFLQPDIDAEELAVVPRVTLSANWRGGFRGCASHCCAAGDVPHSPQPPAWKPVDVAAYLLAGADVVMTASALLRHRPEHAAVLLDGLTTWMARKGFQTIDQFRGMLAVPADTDQEGYERASYVSDMRAANAGAYETY